MSRVPRRHNGIGAPTPGARRGGRDRAVPSVPSLIDDRLMSLLRRTSFDAARDSGCEQVFSQVLSSPESKTEVSREVDECRDHDVHAELAPANGSSHQRTLPVRQKQAVDSNHSEEVLADAKCDSNYQQAVMNCCNEAYTHASQKEGSFDQPPRMDDVMFKFNVFFKSMKAMQELSGASDAMQTYMSPGVIQSVLQDVHLLQSRLSQLAEKSADSIRMMTELQHMMWGWNEQVQHIQKCLVRQINALDPADPRAPAFRGAAQDCLSSLGNLSIALSDWKEQTDAWERCSDCFAGLQGNTASLASDVSHDEEDSQEGDVEYPLCCEEEGHQGGLETDSKNLKNVRKEPCARKPSQCRSSDSTARARSTVAKAFNFHSSTPRKGKDPPKASNIQPDMKPLLQVITRRDTWFPSARRSSDSDASANRKAPEELLAKKVELLSLGQLTIGPACQDEADIASERLYRNAPSHVTFPPVNLKALSSPRKHTQLDCMQQDEEDLDSTDAPCTPQYTSEGSQIGGSWAVSPRSTQCMSQASSSQFLLEGIQLKKAASECPPQSTQDICLHRLQGLCNSSSSSNGAGPSPRRKRVCHHQFGSSPPACDIAGSSLGTIHVSQKSSHFRFASSPPTVDTSNVEPLAPPPKLNRASNRAHSNSFGNGPLTIGNSIRQPVAPLPKTKPAYRHITSMKLQLPSVADGLASSALGPQRT